MKNFRLFIPVALFFLIVSNYSCEKLDIVNEFGTFTFTKDLITTTQTVNSTKAGSYTKENTIDNVVKTKLDSMKITKEKLKAVELKKIVATIDANSTMDFSDIESATLYVNGVKWGDFPTGAKGKSVELTLATSVDNIKDVMLNEQKITYKYDFTTNKPTPEAKIEMALSIKIDYQVF
jgi:hypothetical protein